MSDHTNPLQWSGALTTLRRSKGPMSKRLYMAFTLAMNEAHTRGRLYTQGGERALPSDEFNATQTACERIFFRELRNKAP